MPFALVDEKFPDGSRFEKGGHTCCIHCRNCVMTSRTDIHIDGTWYCPYKKNWFSGNEVFEDNCPAFVRKNCRDCKFERRCKAEYILQHGSLQRYNYELPYTWCREFINKKFPDPDIYMLGRINAYKGKNEIIRNFEKEFKSKINSELSEMRKILNSLRVKNG